MDAIATKRDSFATKRRRLDAWHARIMVWACSEGNDTDPEERSEPAVIEAATTESQLKLDTVNSTSLQEDTDIDPEECMKFLESAHEKFVAERNEPFNIKAVTTHAQITSVNPSSVEVSEPKVAFWLRNKTQVDCPAIFASPVDVLEMRTRPICRLPSGSVWGGLPTAIVADSMLRGKEIKRHFGSWAQVFVHEDKEALAQMPPDSFARVFYVSAGNALYRHPIAFAASAFKNIRSEVFLKKCGGVILLGSLGLWDKLYAPTRASGKTINPSFFDDVTLLLLELDVPVIQLDNEFIDNLPYTSDVHLGAGKARVDLAEHIEDAMVELSQSAAAEKGVDESWEDKFRDACAPKNAAPKSALSGQGCKWCAKGECWDHQGVAR